MQKNDYLQCGVFASKEGASTFVSCPSTPSLATCNLAISTFDPTKHFMPDDQYDQCKVYTSDMSLTQTVTPKIKQYHLSVSISSLGYTSSLDSNNFCTSEGWEYGTMMSLREENLFMAQVSAGGNLFKFVVLIHLKHNI